MRKRFAIVAALTLIGGGSYAAFGRRGEPMRPELTPYDVAWALDVIIFKIDLQDAGVVYGIDLVVIDGQGEEIANGPSIDNGDEPIDLSKSNVIAVSAQMEGQILRGKCSMFGFSTKYQFEGIFLENDEVGWNSTPKRDGDMYWLLAKDSPTMGFGNCPFAEGSTKLAQLPQLST